ERGEDPEYRHDDEAILAGPQAQQLGKARLHHPGLLGCPGMTGRLRQSAITSANTQSAGMLACTSVAVETESVRSVAASRSCTRIAAGNSPSPRHAGRQTRSGPA